MEPPASGGSSFNLARQFDDPLPLAKSIQSQAMP